MEICNKCGKEIKLKNAFEKPSHLFNGDFYCRECRDEVADEFYLSD